MDPKSGEKIGVIAVPFKLAGKKTPTSVDDAKTPGPAPTPQTPVSKTHPGLPPTLQDLESSKPVKPAEIVTNILSEGETVALVARPKTGKTRLMQQFSVAVARGPGAEFLGQPILRGGRVLYIDLESQEADAYARFAKIAGEHWGQVRACIKVHTVRTLADSKVGVDEKGLEYLRSVVRAFKADVLIIDTWRLFVGGKESGAAVVESLRALHKVRSENPKLAIVLLHHLRKRTSGKAGLSLVDDPQGWVEEASGSLAFIAHTDAAFGLEREGRSGSERYIFNGSRRSGTAPLLVLKSDEDTLRFESVGKTEARTELLSSAQHDLWCKLPDQFTWAEAQKIAGGPNGKSLLSGTLRLARECKLLDKPDRGHYQKLISQNP